MLSAQSIHFPPENIEELLILIDQELLVIRNIPATLSTDTMYLYLETFGQIQDFKLVPSIKDQGRQEALLLYRDPEVSKSVLERGLNGIGGFYVEKCNIKHHSYIVSKKIQIYEKSESSNALLSPIFSESGFDFEMEKQVSRRYDTSRDFTISAQKDMASQLIHGYAQLLATGYLTIEKMGGNSF
jgi:hypothetical protein